VHVDGKEIFITGRFPRIARLKGEYYEWLSEPRDFIADLKAVDAGADIFTFVQKVSERTPRFTFHLEWDSLAVLPITTYDEWWKSQINADFGDDLIRGIKGIYDESPLRQGKPFRHYGKDMGTLREEHGSFPDKSQFIGAYYRDDLIGFIKLVHNDGVSHLMQIISKIEHRDKAPTNALLAKAVEICAERGVPLLHYADWSRRGLGDFKKHHAFEQFDLPRYFVPLNATGKMLLFLRLHRKTSDLLPQRLTDVLVRLRSKWNTVKLSSGRFDMHSSS
jgi:hypothetical protein